MQPVVAQSHALDALDEVSDRLAAQRFLVGDTITEADVRLCTTLVRFEPVYHGHFTCNRHNLTELPVLWAYALDLFQTPGCSDTIDVDIQRHYHEVHRDINPTGIVPAGPDLSGWLTPHEPDQLGGRPFGDGTPPAPATTQSLASEPAWSDDLTTAATAPATREVRRAAGSVSASQGRTAVPVPAAGQGSKAEPCDSHGGGPARRCP